MNRYSQPTGVDSSKYELPSYEDFCENQCLRNSLVGFWMSLHWRACLLYMKSRGPMGVFFGDEVVEWTCNQGQEFPHDKPRQDDFARFPLRIEIYFPPSELPVRNSLALAQSNMRTEQSLKAIENIQKAVVDNSVYDCLAAMIDFSNGCGARGVAELVQQHSPEHNRQGSDDPIFPNDPYVIPMLNEDGKLVGKIEASSERLYFWADLEPLVDITPEIKGKFINEASFFFIILFITIPSTGLLKIPLFSFFMISLDSRKMVCVFLFHRKEFRHLFLDQSLKHISCVGSWFGARGRGWRVLP